MSSRQDADALYDVQAILENNEDLKDHLCDALYEIFKESEEKYDIIEILEAISDLVRQSAFSNEGSKREFLGGLGEI